MRAIITKNDGTATPTDQWDLIVSGDGIALLTDTGIGNAANELHIPAQAGTAGANAHLFPVAGTLSVVGANMGNTKKARVLALIEY